ncbi:hypothetical protein [Halosimplex pelagicum]|uniref:Uncharacterized protein n=1 Tax=Halosimplex pelagicum TaxID=869886 RepID=A0A7D5P661_9EURY|nr:hypothetical protein [Halosimplex pelagicum]QLH81806.1 hypothetical protein HZS54_09295 [Halosimplex pelagicum]
MGRTLLGIDLDESPVGGLVEGLLSDEDLEKLTDGGRDVDDDRTADANDEAAVGGDAETDVGTDLVDDAVESGDADDAGSSDAESIPVGTGGDSGSAPWDSPSPEGPDPVPSPGAEDVDDEDGGWKAKLRPVLLKAAAALVVLAVVAFVAYRYLGKAKSVASDKLGSDDEVDSPPTTGAADADVPAARRRAKAPERDDREEFADRPVDETVAHAERAETAGESGAADDEGADREADDEGADREADDEEPDREADGEEPDREADGEEPDTVGRPTADSDVGALVGLAALALVAAVVRKFGEDREYDPLVDGPAGDDE